MVGSGVQNASNTLNVLVALVHVLLDMLPLYLHRSLCRHGDHRSKTQPLVEDNSVKHTSMIVYYLH